MEYTTTERITLSICITLEEIGHRERKHFGRPLKRLK
jgi:hypothetical protein